MSNSLNFSVPYICDEHADKIQVGSLSFNSYGGEEIFSGEIETIICPDDNSLVKDTLNQPGNNRVLVIDAKGVEHASMIGDQIAAKALENNWIGIIVDGFVRDIEVLKTIPIGIYAKGSIPKKTNKNGLGTLGADIFVGGVMIRSGNWIYIDSNGWVIVKKQLEL
jgi:regulator of ribonuclease activity A